MICEACSWKRSDSDSCGSGQVTATKTMKGATKGTWGAAQATNHLFGPIPIHSV